MIKVPVTRFDNKFEKPKIMINRFLYKTLRRFIFKSEDFQGDGFDIQV